MDRRRVSKLLLASAAGASLAPRQANAQSCTLPCYPQTAAELAASVTPANLSFPPGDLRRYGTNTTPGTTDMTSALSDAIKATDGGELALPAETILTGSQSLGSLSKGIKIRGAGMGLTVLRLKQTAGSTQVFGGIGEAVNDITIEDVTIDGNASVHGVGGSAPNNSVLGLRLGDNASGGVVSNRIRINRVRVLDVTEHGIAVSRCNDFEIDGCTISGFDGGFGILSFRGGKYGRITNNYVTTSTAAAVGIMLDDRSTSSTTSEPHSECTIAGNVIDGQDVLSTGISAPAASGIVVTGNAISRCNAAGINVDENESGSLPESVLKHTVVVGNTIRGQNNAGVNSASILVAGSFVNITGNNVSDGKASGILVWRDLHSVNPEHVNISSNTIDNCGQSKGSSIELKAGTHISVSANTLSNNQRFGVRVLPEVAMADINVIGNSIEGVAFDGVEIRSDAGAVSNVSVKSNHISRVDTGFSGQRAAIRLHKGATSLSDITVSDNTIFNEANASFGVYIVHAGIRGIRLSDNRAAVTTGLNSSAVNDDIVHRDGNSFDRRVMYGTAAPTGGTWSVGDIMYNLTPVAGGALGWVCTTGGAPGTWKTFGDIAA